MNWVSINVHLPEKGGKYLVMTKDSNGDLQEHYAYYDDASWWAYDDTQNLDSRVVMWRRAVKAAE